ncbi:MAG TPA: hypothetical protein VF748_15205 [Candidatus Acidoferrum sp.]
MPVILNTATIASGAVNPNVIAGSAFEFARVQSVYSIGIFSGIAGMFATIQGGSDIIAEEFPVPVSGIAANNPSGAAMTTTSQFPVVPDSMFFHDVLNPGDRMVIRVRNPTGGAGTVAFVVQIQPTGQ